MSGETSDANSDDEESDRAPKKRKSSSSSDGFANEEEVNAFRNKLMIKVKGNNISHPSTSFEGMKLHESVKSVVISNIENSLWKEPTAVQMQAIPIMLQGRDVLAAAPTGSGKTGAFVLPVLSLVSEVVAAGNNNKKQNELKLVSNSKKDKKKKETQKQPANDSNTNTGGIKGLILAPTKELADQIHREALRLCAGRRLKITVLSKKLVSTALAQQVLRDSDCEFEYFRSLLLSHI